MNKQRGFTLLELLIAILVIAAMSSGLYTVVLSVRKGGGRADRRFMAGAAARSLHDALRNYVSADPTTDMGPNKNRSGAQTWNIHTPGLIADSMGDVYALAPGPPAHQLTGFLETVAPPWFKDPPYNATIKYLVTPSANPALLGPEVSVDVDWDEPKP
ncbi:MAG: hypothetical protein A3J74_11475 [Elusimicrobia bacterium RIFCSPHIGHO2_02_FULL_57_9]|nr:MAG: hypothetical protein A3J74_11475 [Elusimicrobia bacterium RIFCSPHIGHO2_02_FULL_57_9]